MTVKTSRHEAYTARFVIGAYGKRTALDQQMGRRFMTRRSPWLAVKAHYRGRFDDDLVALHQFRGGYCGVSKVEGGLINVCYLSRLEAFRAYKNTHDFQEQVLYKNKQLKSILTQCEMTGDNPLSISQISFDRKELIKDHTLMIGDAAGLIHPMCGNGMAMAIHSAKLCAELMVRQFEQGITDRAQLEQHYTHAWKHHFSQRLAMGRLLAAALQRERLSEWMMATMMKFPSLFNYIIRKTHGQYLYQK